MTLESAQLSTVGNSVNVLGTNNFILWNLYQNIWQGLSNLFLFQ